MVTTLYLIRHGETEGSETKRYKGSIDVPLSEKGFEQMKGTSVFIQNMIQDGGYNPPLSPLGKGGSKGGYHESCIVHRASSKLSAIYCSPLSRALKSAEVIAEPFGLKPVIVPELKERHFGIWEGMTFTEIKEKYPQEFEAWATNPLRYSPMGGESTIEVRDRTVSALNKIIDNHNCSRIQDEGCRIEDKNNYESCIMDPASSSNIAIVAHGGVNRIILCHILEIPLENIFRIEQDFAAVNIIEFHDKYPVIKLLNGGLN